MRKPPRCDLDLRWWVGVTLPFDWKWSKNSMWVARAGTYARRLADHARARRAHLALELGAALRRAGHTPVVNELWFLIHVELPDHKGDAINCLDLVADGIEDATGVDDRWYQLAGLTWEITRKAPALHVWVGQNALEPAKRRRPKPVAPEPEPPPDGSRPPPWI